MGKRIVDWLTIFRPTRGMEGKLIIVFLFLIILPMGILSYVSAQRYSVSIESNTVTYASQLSDQMMDKLDDYLEDMKKISIIPSYLEEIKQGHRCTARSASPAQVVFWPYYSYALFRNSKPIDREATVVLEKGISDLRMGASPYDHRRGDRREGLCGYGSRTGTYSASVASGSYRRSHRR